MCRSTYSVAQWGMAKQFFLTVTYHQFSASTFLAGHHQVHWICKITPQQSRKICLATVWDCHLTEVHQENECTYMQLHIFGFNMFQNKVKQFSVINRSPQGDNNPRFFRPQTDTSRSLRLWTLDNGNRDRASTSHGAPEKEEKELCTCNCKLLISTNLMYKSKTRVK